MIWSRLVSMVTSDVSLVFHRDLKLFGKGLNGVCFPCRRSSSPSQGGGSFNWRPESSRESLCPRRSCPGIVRFRPLGWRQVNDQQHQSTKGNLILSGIFSYIRDRLLTYFLTLEGCLWLHVEMQVRLCYFLHYKIFFFSED